MESMNEIDKYIAQFPKHTQEILQKIRQVIHKAAPDATEAMRYGIPTFIQNGNLVHFAAFKTHIGLYPTPSGIEAFKKEIKEYKWAKGSVQFPLDKPIPYDLITDIVLFRTRGNKK